MILRTGMAFFSFIFFCFLFFLFRFPPFFFFLECDCLLCAICDTWLRACLLKSKMIDYCNRRKFRTRKTFVL